MKNFKAIVIRAEKEAVFDNTEKWKNKLKEIFPDQIITVEIEEIRIAISKLTERQLKAIVSIANREFIEVLYL